MVRHTQRWKTGMLWKWATCYSWDRRKLFRMTVCSWSCKYLTKKCFAVSSTNVWVFGLGDVVGQCPGLLEKSRSQIFFYKLVKTHPKSCLCPLNSNSQSGRWFHHLLTPVTQNPFGPGVPGLLSTLSWFARAVEGVTGKVCCWPPMLWASFKELAAPTCGCFMLKLVLCSDFLRMLNERGSTTVFLESLPNSCLFES